MPSVGASREHSAASGHLPLKVSDKLVGRYIVRKNIHVGTNSSTWLVEHFKLKRVAAMKVLTAEESKRSKEMEVAKHLQEKQEQDDSHPGKEHVVRIFDTFTINSPNGQHHCIVMELLGISLAEDVSEGYQETGGNFPRNFKTKVASQVALGVAYLHKCGIVHGNLNRGNVLFYSRKLEELRHTPTKKYPEVTFDRQHIIKCCLEYNRDVHVKVCDFGEASTAQSMLDQVYHLNGSVLYRPPEVLFGDARAPAFSMDIWSLGVLIFNILNDGKYPFPDNRADNAEESMIKLMVMVLGRLPAKWWNNWAARGKFFHDSGKHIPSGQIVPVIFFAKMPAAKSFTDNEIKAMAGLFKKMFQYMPEKRINAKEVVEGFPTDWIPNEWKAWMKAQKRKN